MGQLHGVKIALGLGQIDADAADNGILIGDALTENPHNLFAPQQQIIGPLDLTVNAVTLPQGVRHGQAGEEGQRFGLGQGNFQHDGVVQRLPGGVHPGTAQPSPARRLAGGVDRPHRAEPVQMFLGPGVGAAHLGEIKKIVAAIMLLIVHAVYHV